MWRTRGTKHITSTKRNTTVWNFKVCNNQPTKSFNHTNNNLLTRYASNVKRSNRINNSVANANSRQRLTEDTATTSRFVNPVIVKTTTSSDREDPWENNKEKVVQFQRKKFFFVLHHIMIHIYYMHMCTYHGQHWSHNEQPIIN